MPHMLKEMASGFSFVLKDTVTDLHISTFQKLELDFYSAEGGELKRSRCEDKPRKKQRLMINRVLINIGYPLVRTCFQRIRVGRRI